MTGVLTHSAGAVVELAKSCKPPAADPTKPELLLTELGVGYRLSTDEIMKTTQH